MAHVVSTPHAPFSSASGSFEVHQVPAATDNLVWLLVCKQTRTCAVVDGPDADNALAYAREHGLTISMVLNTHTHGDHIGVNLHLQKHGLLAGMQVIGAAAAREQVPGITQAVQHGDSVQVGALTGRVLAVDGHMQGHIAFLFEDVLFCGDALFTGGCGRVFTGDFVTMQQSLSRMAALPPETRVCCAHEYTEDNLAFARSVEPGNTALQLRSQQVRSVRAQGGCVVPSLLSEELATNPMLRWGSTELQEQLRKQSPDATLDSPAAIFTATRKLKDSGQYKQR
jgi:hydroxyacylglutathione hydrolase